MQVEGRSDCARNIIIDSSQQIRTTIIVLNIEGILFTLITYCIYVVIYLVLRICYPDSQDVFREKDFSNHFLKQRSISS